MIPRRLFLLPALAAIALVSYSQSKTVCRLKGKLASSATGYVYLGYPGNAGKWQTDSCLLKEGVFSFEKSISHPTLARLFYKKSSTELFLESPLVTVSGKEAGLDNTIVKGSSVNDEFNKLNAAIKKIEERWKIVMDTLFAVNRRSNAAFQELKGWVLVPYFTEINELTYQFYDDHPRSYVTAYSLQIAARDLSTDSLQLFYNRFSTAVKQSRYGKDIAAQIEKRKVGVPGTRAALFSKTDINGNAVSLENFRGKYVLLDFWGSWCVPCRKGNPHLKELYAKYKDKGFEIIGIAADDETQDAWRKAIAEDGLPWLHILDGNGSAKPLSGEYNVVYYPTQVLIDQQGMIIGRYSEGMEELDAMLAKKLNIER
jgi:thiol-disulfide isomerase/thioredoxin